MKKNKMGLKYWLSLVAVMLGIIAFFMLFLPAMSTEIKGSDKVQGVYNGFHTAFGYNEKGTQIIGFSFVNFLGVLCIVLGVLIALVNFIAPNLFKGKAQTVVTVICAALFCAGGIIAFSTVLNVALLGPKWSMLENSLREGAIIQGILAMAAGLCAFVSIYAWDSHEEMSKKIEEAIVEKAEQDAENQTEEQ